MRLPGALAAVALFIVASTICGVIVALGMRLTPELLRTTLASQEIRFAVALSLKCSLIALLIALLLGIPTAWLLAKHQLPGKVALSALLELPLVMPPLVAGLGLLLLFSRSMPGNLLVAGGLNLLFSQVGIVVAQAFVGTPVIIQTARAAFSSVDERYGKAAATLGASSTRIWFTIELPLASAGLAAGAVMAWSRALGEFGVTLLLAGATHMRTETLPMAIYLNLATGDTDLAIACAVILLLLAALMLFFIRLLAQRYW